MSAIFTLGCGISETPFSSGTVDQSGVARDTQGVVAHSRREILPELCGTFITFLLMLDRFKPFYCIWVTFDEIDKQRRLSIWLSATLFPVLQCANVGP